MYMKQAIKKTLAVTLAAAMLCGTAAFTEAAGFIGKNTGSLTVNAAGEEASSESFEYTENSDGSLTVTKYTGSETEVSVPAQINGKAVTVIGLCSFSGNAEIISVSLPECVTSIEEDAFYRCTRLRSINIPDGVEKIDCAAFEGCQSLESVTIPDSVTYIAESAFEGCTGMTSLTLPQRAFIGLFAFNGCTALKSLTVPGGTRFSDESAFAGCTGLESVVIQSGLEVIEDATFCGCKSLKSVTLPAGITRIGASAFSGCEKLTEITIPEGVKTVEESVFNGCVSLRTVNIPKSVTTIFNNAFTGCTSLETFNADSKNKTFSSVGGVLFSKDKTTLASFPRGRKGTYTVPSNVSTIGSQAFRDCTGLTGVTIPDGVRTIKAQAFYGCTGLKSIKLPKSISVIYVFAFGQCTALKEIALPEGLKVIHQCTFSECTNLKSVTIPDSVVSIGNYAFRGCTALSDIRFSKNLTKIEKYALTDSLWYKNRSDGVIYAGSVLLGYKGKMPKKTKITVKNGTKTISAEAFSGCGNLTGITIPASVTSVEDMAFSNCSRLSSISLPDSVEHIGSGAFAGTGWSDAQPDGVVYIGKAAYCYKGKMPKKTKLTIKNGTAIIADGAFCNQKNLVSVRLPEGLKTVGENAFGSCRNLSDITFPDSLEAISDSSVTGTKWREKWYGSQPDGVVYIGKVAFDYKGKLPKDNIIRIKDGTKSISGFCITDEPQSTYPGTLGGVVIPKSVKAIEDYSIGYYYDREDESYPKLMELVIYGAKDSAAEEYARDNDFVFRQMPELNKTKKTIGVGEKYTLKADMTVTWSSGDKNTAAVSGGIVTGKKTGTAIITARTAEGAASECKITVKAAPSKVTLNKERKTIGVGESFTLKATLPDGTASGVMKWTSSNTNVVTVKDGKLTAKKTGTATITVKTFNGKTAKCKVTVKAAPSKVTLSKTALTMSKGKTYTLKATLPSGTASGIMKWTSSNTSVVTVKDGKLTAKKAGTATITVKTFNSKTAKCKVTVK